MVLHESKGRDVLQTAYIHTLDCVSGFELILNHLEASVPNVSTEDQDGGFVWFLEPR